MREFLKRKGVELSMKKYLVEGSTYMSLGLFSTLLIGTILNTFGEKLGIEFLSKTLWSVARDMTGAGIGVAVAYGLNAPHLVLFSAIVTGSVGYLYGGPIGAFIATLVGVEFGKIVFRETKVDILVTPATTIISGAIVVSMIGPLISKLMLTFGAMVVYATELRPFVMGVVVSTIVGLTLTLPISSAALCMTIGLGGIAGGAATVGCSAQMIGFAVMSFRENSWGGLVAQGLGTSMLQIGNIIKNPRIWIPPTLAGMIVAPLSTVVFKIQNIPLGSGMGTSGLVGQFGVIKVMGEQGLGGYKLYLIIFLLHFLLPSIITLVISSFMRKKGWIKDGDLKLKL